MLDDEENELTPQEYADQIHASQHKPDGKRAALQVLSHAAKFREVGEWSVVCDEQREELEGAVEAVERAADAIWPGDEDVPNLEELAKWPRDEEDEE